MSLNYSNDQIGTNNCTARYRTLSGGVGESPSLSPSPSSDYENDLAHGLSMMNGGAGPNGGAGSSSLDGAKMRGVSMDNTANGALAGGGLMMNGKTNKGARSKGADSGGVHYNLNHKGSSVIIQQKATVHHVSYHATRILV